MSDLNLQCEYERLKSQAEVLAGGLTDIPRRVGILTSIYLDSGRNHAFSQMAAHGALWALGYFEAGGSLGRLVAKRYSTIPKKKRSGLASCVSLPKAFGRSTAWCVSTPTRITILPDSTANCLRQPTWSQPPCWTR